MELNLSVEETKYFGGQNGDIVAALRANGYQVVAPALGPLSSNWERCCELFAILTGQEVDYGIDRARRFGHSRFGKDYTGNPLVPGFFFGDTKINMIGHSMVRFVK